MSELNRPEPGTSQSDGREYDDQYHSMSALAVTVTILGLLSCASLLTPNLWFLPPLVVVLGAVAIRTLKSNPEKIGRKGVLVGITLAVLFGTWAPARYYSRKHMLYRQARQYADAWIDLVRHDKLYKAHQLHLPKIERVADDAALKDEYNTIAYAKSEFYAFYEEKPLQAILKSKGRVSVEFQALEDYEPLFTQDLLTLRYLVTYEEQGQQKTIPMRIALERQRDLQTGDHDWYVYRVM